MANIDSQLDTLDARGNWQYPSAAKSGHVEIMVPSLPGSPRETETLHARDFGVHVIAKIESSFKRNPYLKSGPQQRPSEVFAHYLASAKGAQLMDSATIGRMERLAKEFETEPDREGYFRDVLKPWLRSLSPKRR